ncbi:MAG: YitT family protein [Bacteroidaceae bacterium]|nr:YitT family protein [Bacteroidaceae bacterium]
MIRTLLNKKDWLLREAKDYLFITLGLSLYAVGWTVFLLPYEIVSGGVTGVSAIIYYATGFPIGYSFFLINAALLIMALRILGFKFMTKTIYAIFMASLMLTVARTLVVDDSGNLIQILGPGQEFMSIIIGCSLIGMSLAIVFLHNGSTGGTDIIAACINKYKPISLGRILIVVDLIIIGSSYFVFHDPKKLVFGFCTLIVCDLMVDYVMNARRESVQFLIFSKKWNEVADALGNAMHRGITLLDGKGWYTGDDTKVICLVTKRRESVNVFRIIKLVDPDAFVSQSSVIGVYGKGFDKIKVKVNEKDKTQLAGK